MRMEATARAQSDMIFEAIPAIMEDIGAIGKDRKNEQQGFRFRGIDDVMNAIKPILTRHRVFVVPEVLEQVRERRATRSGTEILYSLLKVRFRFCAPDGSHIDAVTIGEGMDSGDKASNKAMSIAFKYALFQVFCIPTEEMADPDAQTPPSTTAAPETKAAQVPAQAGINPDYICAECGQVIKSCLNSKGELTISAHDVYEKSIDNFKKPLCVQCAKEYKHKADEAAAKAVAEAAMA